MDLRALDPQLLRGRWYIGWLDEDDQRGHWPRFDVVKLRDEGQAIAPGWYSTGSILMRPTHIVLPQGPMGKRSE